MELIDSHAHLTNPRFAPEVDAVVRRAREAGVSEIVTIGADLADSRAALALAKRSPGVHATAGIHPHAADTATGEALRGIAELVRAAGVVAVGETGLDYHYDNAPRERQRSAFAAHLELARETGLPVVVHTRGADEDTRALLREAGQGTTGVLHCFSAGRALLEDALEMGWSISFTGLITFRNYLDADLLRAVPADRIMVETDSPYLAPVPYRGRRNEPAFVTEVLLCAAELRGEDPADLARATVRNTRSFFRLSDALPAGG